METLQESVAEYKRQMEKGSIQKAYKGIMDYVLSLRTHFANRYPKIPVGNLYAGYMDMTYFPLFPKSLKSNKLKIAVVFMHGTCRFEIWLSGNNRQIQQKYSKIIADAGWKKFGTNPENPDSIVEETLIENPDFDDPDKLTKIIEASTMSFIQDVEAFLSGHAK